MLLKKSGDPMVILISKPYITYIRVECKSRHVTSALKWHFVPAVAWALLRTSTHKENKLKANTEVGAYKGIVTQIGQPFKTQIISIP